MVDPELPYSANIKKVGAPPVRHSVVVFHVEKENAHVTEAAATTVLSMLMYRYLKNRSAHV